MTLDPIVNPFDAVMDITARPPIVFVSGRGSWLTDSDGNSFLDFIQGWAVNCLGHSPQPIIQALAKQAAELINVSVWSATRQRWRAGCLVRRSGGVTLIQAPAHAFKVPRQQLVHASDRMISDAREYFAQVIRKHSASDAVQHRRPAGKPPGSLLLG